MFGASWRGQGTFQGPIAREAWAGLDRGPCTATPLAGIKSPL